MAEWLGDWRRGSPRQAGGVLERSGLWEDCQDTVGPLGVVPMSGSFLESASAKP